MSDNFKKYDISEDISFKIKNDLEIEIPDNIVSNIENDLEIEIPEAILFNVSEVERDPDNVDFPNEIIKFKLSPEENITAKLINDITLNIKENITAKLINDITAEILNSISIIDEDIDLKITNNLPKSIKSKCSPKFKKGSFIIEIFSPEEFEIASLERVKINTKLKLKIPDGYEGQIKTDKNLSSRFGVIISNSPYTLSPKDNDNLMLSLSNIDGSEIVKINVGDKIAELTISPIKKPLLK